MQIIAQVYSEKGFYGEAIKLQGNTLEELNKKLTDALAAFPDELEGVKKEDWTMISTITVK